MIEDPAGPAVLEEDLLVMASDDVVAERPDGGWRTANTAFCASRRVVRSTPCEVCGGPSVTASMPPDLRDMPQLKRRAN